MPGSSQQHAETYKFVTKFATSELIHFVARRTDKNSTQQATAIHRI